MVQNGSCPGNNGGALIAMEIPLTSFDDKQCYDDILPIYKQRPENPREKDSKMIREVVGIEHVTLYSRES
jgi:hypothetical protein